MTTLATRENGNGVLAIATETKSAALYTFEQKMELAKTLHSTGFIKGVRSQSDALALMMVCEAQGRHIGEAITRFHIIEGSPTVKAEVMLSDFQARGGRVEWLETNNEICHADFWSDRLHPKRFPIRFKVQDFIDNGDAMAWDKDKREYVIKKNWRNRPGQMMRARACTTGIRAVDPGAIHGFYSDDEMEGLDDRPRLEPIQAYVSSPGSQVLVPASPVQKPRGRDIRVPGQPEGLDIDGRGLVDIIAAAADKLGKPGPHVWADLKNRAVQAGHHTGEVPTKVAAVAAMLVKLYDSSGPMRDWLRTQLAAIEEDALRKAEEAAQAPAPDEGKAAVNSLFPAVPDDLAGREAGYDG